MTSVTIEGHEHRDKGKAEHRDGAVGVEPSDAAGLVTAELPVVTDAELAPPFPDHPDAAGATTAPVAPEPLESAPDMPEPVEAVLIEPDMPEPEPVEPEPVEPEPVEPEPVEPEPARRVIVIGDADALTAAPSAPAVDDGSGASRVVLPSVTPGPAVIKQRGPLVFGESTGITLGTTDAGLAGNARVGDALAGATTLHDPGDRSAGEPRVVVIGDVDATPPEVDIDPRIKARRTQVKRSAGLRRLRAIVLIVVALAIVFGGGTVLRSYVLVVRSVVVTGTSATPPDVIEQAVNSVAGRSMVDVSLVDLRKQIEASPWVKAVDVTRDWPSTIRIDVLERRPVAFYRGVDDHGYIVDELGLVLVRTDGQPADFLEVTGALDPVDPGSVAPDTVRAGAQVANAIPPSLRPRVSAIDSKATGVSLRLLGPRKSQILLGSTDDLAAKLVTVLAFQDACPPDSYDTLDVRVPGKPVATPASGCTLKRKGA